MAESNVAQLLQQAASKIAHCVITDTTGQLANKARYQVSILFKGEYTFRVAYHDDPIIALGVAMYTKRQGIPHEPGVRYWHHAESGALFKTKHSDPDPREAKGAADVEEVSRDDYMALLIQYGETDKPVAFQAGDPSPPPPPEPVKPEKTVKAQKSSAKADPPPSAPEPVEEGNDYDDIL